MAHPVNISKGWVKILFNKCLYTIPDGFPTSDSRLFGLSPKISIFATRN